MVHSVQCFMLFSDCEHEYHTTGNIRISPRKYRKTTGNFPWQDYVVSWLSIHVGLKQKTLRQAILIRTKIMLILV